METGARRIHVRVNGEDREIPEGFSLAALLRELGFDRARVAVERNRDVIPKAHYDTTILQAGDRLEIVGFVGGG